MLFPNRNIKIKQSGHLLKMETLMKPFLQPPPVTMSLVDLGSPFFSLNNLAVKRTDHVCSKIPFSLFAISAKLPTVIYIHSYNSNRLEGKGVLQFLLNSKLNVVCIEIQRVNPEYMKNHTEYLDSKNGIITFGHLEFEQIRPVFMWVKKYINQKIILWGRSMGAVCAINYQHKYRDAHCLILDSPFKSLLETFSMQISNKTNIPTFIAAKLVKLFSGKISEIIKFNIEQMEMGKKMTFSTPILFIANKNDSISGNSSQFLYSLAKGKKKIIFTEADHDAQRQDLVINESIQFIKEILKSRQMSGLQKKEFPRSSHTLKKSRLGNLDENGRISSLHLNTSKKIPIQNHRRLQTFESQQLTNTNKKDDAQRMDVSCLF